MVGGPKLVRTLFIGIIIIVIWAVFDYVCMQEMIVSTSAEGGGINKGSNKCSTLYQCVGTHFMEGLSKRTLERVFGGFGGGFGYVSKDVSLDYVQAFRGLWLLLFFMIWYVILILYKDVLTKAVGPFYWVMW